MINTISDRLSKALSPTALEVLDESYKHAGHSGSRPGGETHFKIIIASPKLQGTRLAQHKIIMDLLKTELATTIHALSIEIQK